MSQLNIRIGHGYDVHRFSEGRRLVLGGVEVPYTMGLLGHSDADVLVHALMDAMLGAACLGDIGRHFPDSSSAFKDIDSLVLLGRVKELLLSNGFIIGNADCTIIAQEPKLSGYIPEMKKRLAAVLDCDESLINIKATTEEHLGFTGKLEGISAHAVCIIQRI